MAIAEKMALLGEIERAVGEYAVANALRKIMAAITDAMALYEVQRTEAEDAEEDMLEAYLAALDVEGRSRKTIERYRYIISKMAKAVKAPTRKITVYHLRGYLTREKERGISERTLEGERQIFSAYFNWLHREGLVEKNPCANLGAVKYARRQKDVYTEADMERLKFGCTNARDRAIVCFLMATGCRISEMTMLNRDDVDIVNLECRVTGKGSKERTVFLDQVAAMTLQMYLETRDDDSPALFAGRGTDRISAAGVRRMLGLLGKRAGVEHVYPHKFRRTTATGLIRHGMPIQEVAAILGHDKLDTTMTYVVLDKTDIRSAYRKYA